MADAIAWAAALIEFSGALVIAVAAALALWALAQRRGVERARLVLIGGVLGALGFKTAATLLKAIELGTWRAIGTFAAILALRTVVKRLFAWEGRRILSAHRPYPWPRTP